MVRVNGGLVLGKVSREMGVSKQLECVLGEWRGGNVSAPVSGSKARLVSRLLGCSRRRPGHTLSGLKSKLGISPPRP